MFGLVCWCFQIRTENKKQTKKALQQWQSVSKQTWADIGGSGWSQARQTGLKKRVVVCFKLWRGIIIKISMKASQFPYKYSKIAPQKKFHLLKLVLGQRMLIKDAAKIVGINYSTAKTILFFHRNGDRSYQFQRLKNEDINAQPQKTYATFRDKSIDQDMIRQHTSFCPSFGVVQVISTVGSRNALFSPGHKPHEGTSGPLLHDDSFQGLNRAQQNVIIFEQEAPKTKKQKIDLTRPMTRSQSLPQLDNSPCKVEQSQQMEFQIKKQES